MRKTLSLAVGSLLTAGLVAGPITAATASTTSASVPTVVSPASPISCYYTVFNQYPYANPWVVYSACLTGAWGTPQARHECVVELRNDGVPSNIANEACRRAPFGA